MPISRPKRVRASSVVSGLNEDPVMTATTAIAKVAQVLLLSTGLVAAGAAWSCPQATGADAGQPSSAAQAPTPGGLSPTELYAALHDVALNKKDGLGNYDDDYRARYPN